jgi:hypothetical protein
MPALTSSSLRVDPSESSLDQRVAALIAALATAAATALVANIDSLKTTLTTSSGRAATVLVLTIALQMFSVRVYGRGSVSVSAIGILSGVFLLAPGAAIAIAALAAGVQWLRTRPKIYKAAFDVSNYSLSAGGAALVFHAVQQWRLGAAILAGVTYTAINNGALCLAMSWNEQVPLRTVWFERFHWARFHFALFGPLALAATIAYEQIGIAGLAAFTLPPGLMMLSVRQYLERTTAAVEEIRQVNLELRRAHRDTIAALSRSMEAKDVYTGGHTERVAGIAVELARELGFANGELEAIEIGALLHDIGKIGVPEQILRKPGPLDEAEWEVIRTHPLVSDYILSELDLHPFVRECARSSHERIDGQGYPDGLAGDEIPLSARIVFVADAFDALTSRRPYRPARPVVAALAEIEANTGTQFCPRIVAALRTIWRNNPHLLAREQPPQRDAA